MRVVIHDMSLCAYLVYMCMSQQENPKYLNLHQRLIAAAAVTHLCVLGMQDPHAPPVRPGLQDVII